MALTLNNRSTLCKPQAKLSPEQQAWLDALRSGEYEQGRNAMCNLDGTMCCLGVLCDVVDPDGWVVLQVGPDCVTGRQEGDVDVHYAWGGLSDREVVKPPQWVRELVGIDQEALGDLIMMNDSKHRTFKQIANWLERYWLTGKAKSA